MVSSGGTGYAPVQSVGHRCFLNLILNYRPFVHQGRGGTLSLVSWPSVSRLWYRLFCFWCILVKAKQTISVGLLLSFNGCKCLTQQAAMCMDFSNAHSGAAERSKIRGCVGFTGSKITLWWSCCWNLIDQVEQINGSNNHHMLESRAPNKRIWLRMCEGLLTLFIPYLPLCTNRGTALLQSLGPEQVLCWF